MDHIIPNVVRTTRQSNKCLLDGVWLYPEELSTKPNKSPNVYVADGISAGNTVSKQTNNTTHTINSHTKYSSISCWFLTRNIHYTLRSNGDILSLRYFLFVWYTQCKLCKLLANDAAIPKMIFFKIFLFNNIILFYQSIISSFIVPFIHLIRIITFFFFFFKSKN